MRSRYVATLGVLTSGLFLAVSPAPLKAQHAISEMDLKVRNVRASGQPVLPIFEGWYRNPGGTYDLCFGYLNLNQEEALEIPLGPDNFIEPERFDGGQPTHFLDDATRLTCIFTVNVPEDIGSERVWWNLRIDGQTYKVPGHVTSRAYMIENLSASFPPLIEEEQIATFGDLRMQSERVGATSPGVAPVVRFVEPAGPEGRGKSGMTAGPVTTRVGNPLALAIRVTGPDGGGLSNDGSVRWGKLQGPPGEVMFSAETSRYSAGSGITQSTEVTFSEPGDYVVFVQVLQGSFGNQCCWTNGYVRVRVTS